MNFWLPDCLYKIYPRFLGAVGIIGSVPVSLSNSITQIILGYSASALLISYSIYIFYQRFTYSQGDE